MTRHLETALLTKRATGRKLLVPYITGGFPGWERAIEAAAHAGADAVEIGLPFSDPVMDGPVIQEASQTALDAGATPVAILQAMHQRVYRSYQPLNNGSCSHASGSGIDVIPNGSGSECQ